ncbi:zinc-dependent alcohol dehydrogenase family protein [Paenibacillus sp. UNC451MF]|uniref:zinc-dependent alcohol dehydrogenase family protein n=1 Tax=Paenibacillus sp. UNC451MF TaxID=1449063 RepID=UPI00048B7861|nr:zinc-dependent alcohol dehydrogenase family protein [Paenibacillus sp. UNC451MF]
MIARYITCTRFGNPKDVLQVQYKEVVRPEPGELLVQMLTSPINPSDLIPVSGAYAHRIALPMIPGYEGVGIVTEVGKNVSSTWLGQRVLALRGEGTWQEFVRVPAELAIPVPETIHNDTASQLYINPVTAWLISKQYLASDDIVLINACGSSIGRIFTQLSKVIGFQVIAVTRNQLQTEDLLLLGASHVINTSTTSLQEAVMEITQGRGVKVGIDSIGGSAAEELAQCVQIGGTVLSIGLLSGKPVDWTRIARQTGVKPALYWLRHWVARVSAQEWHEPFRHIVELIQNSQLQLDPPRLRFELSNIREAVIAATANGKSGKTSLTFQNYFPNDSSFPG